MKYAIGFLLVFANLIVSAQSGITWNMGMNISTNTYGNMHPRIALDGAGEPMVIWGKMSDKSVQFSRWDGSGFTTPVRLNSMGMDIASASWMGPSIASKGDTVYVVMKRSPEAIDTNHVFIVTSFNGGISFGAPVRVSFIADSISRFPTVTVDALGNPLVAFMKFDPNFTDARWVVATSSDFGNTFSVDVKASGWSGAGAEVCDCCPGAIISSGATTAMLYRDNLSNIRDTWTGISNNNGLTFGNGYNVDNNNWFIASCPSSGPDGVIIGDTLYSTFMSSGSGAYRTYMSAFPLNGGSSASVSNLTGAITGLTQQNYPRMASHGNAVAIVWKQNISGVAELPILFTNNIYNGFPTYEVVDLNDVTNTDVALGDGTVFTVWQDDNSGTVKFRKGNYVPLGTGIDNIDPIKFSVHPNPAASSLYMNTNVTLKNVELILSNVLGEVVLQKNTDLISGSYLNVEALNSGIYFLKINTGSQLLIQKFIKL